MSAPAADRWTDQTMMPFGKYAGRNLGDIPDDYIVWLGDQTWLSKYPGLQLYVDAFLEVRRKERVAAKTGRYGARMHRGA